MEQMSSNLSLLAWDPQWGLLVVPSFDFFTLKLILDGGYTVNYSVKEGTPTRV